MRVWEFERHDWASLAALGGAAHVPAALDALSSATTEDEATEAYWQVDNHVVVQGTPYEAAVATAAAVIALLPICTSASRPFHVELLEQITGGDSATPDTLQAKIFTEIVLGYGFYVTLVQHGAEFERSLCVDLLLYCARYDRSLRARTAFYLQRVAQDETNTDDLRRYAAARLQFEKNTW